VVDDSKSAEDFEEMYAMRRPAMEGSSMKGGRKNSRGLLRARTTAKLSPRTRPPISRHDLSILCFWKCVRGESVRLELDE
jgi:hypothetical protein